jgi:hypothetical protein
MTSTAKPSTTSPKKKDDGDVAPVEENGLITQDAAAPHVLQFRSPVYVAMWLDDRHCVIGGGGGKSFGMTNGLAVLAVCPTGGNAASGSPSSESVPLWSFRGSVDLRRNILWCISNLDITENAAAATAKGPQLRNGYLCLSHLDSFSLIEVKGIRSPDCSPAPDTVVAPPTLTKVCRVALVTDDEKTGEPEKKPIAMAGGYIFAAQDNQTIAVVRLAHLLNNKAKRDKLANSTKADDEANSSFAAFNSANETDIAATIAVGTRVNDMSARQCPWDSNLIYVVASGKDKHLHVIYFDAAKGVTSKTHKFTGDQLGFKGKALMRSSLRLVTSYEQQLPSTEKLAAPMRGGQDALAAGELPASKDGEDATMNKDSSARSKRHSAVHLAFLVLSLVDGVSYAQRIILTSKTPTPLVEAPLKFGTEAPTAVSHCRLAGGSLFTGVLIATADGSVVEVQDRGTHALRVTRRREGLHAEPISAIAMHANGAIISADIAQRVIISYAGVLGRPRAPAMRLFKQSGASLGVVKAYAASPYVWLLLAVIVALLIHQFGV